MSRQRHSRRSFGVDDPNFLIPSADISLPSTQIQSTAGLATSWQNVGLLGDTADVDTIVGTAANLRVHPSGSILFGGSAGDYVSTPDSPANSITSSFCLLAYVYATDFMPTADETIAGKYLVTGNQRSLVLQINGVTGYLRLVTSATGGAAVQSLSTVKPTIPSGAPGIWVGVIWNDAADVANYYTSNQPRTTASTDLALTLLGDADIAHASAGIFDSTALFMIGSYSSGASGNFSGTVDRAILISGTDSTATPAVSFNAADAGQANGLDGDTFTSGGVTWTTHGNTFANNTGHTGVKFLGSAGLETSAGGVTINQPMHIFMVAEADALTGANQFFLDGESDAAATVSLYAVATTDEFRADAGAALDLAAGDTGIHVWSLAHNGDTSSNGQVSGTAVATGTIGTENLDALSIGLNSAGALSLQGSMYALYIFKQRVLPPPTIERLERFLTP